MDKYEVYEDIHRRMITAVKMGGTPEGALIIGVIGQACQDAIGLYNSAAERVYSDTEVDEMGRRKWVTVQQDAINWFRAKGHYPFADMVGLQPTWVNHLLKTKAGVEI